MSIDDNNYGRVQESDDNDVSAADTAGNHFDGFPVGLHSASSTVANTSNVQPLHGSVSDGNNSTSSGLRSKIKEQVRQYVFVREQMSLSELSGACGDFGTLIPLLIAMARGRTIYLAPTLFLSGIVHIVTGCYWDIPMPLQPMKAIASLAIAGELTRLQVTTAGIGMGICFLGLSINNTIDIVNRWVPVAVIAGLQLGVGWRLALKGIHMIQDLPWWFGSSMDCITLSCLCGLLCLYGMRKRSSFTHTTNRRGTSESIMHEEDEVVVDALESREVNATADLQPVGLGGTKNTCRQMIEEPPVGILLFLLGIFMAAIQLAGTNENGNDGQPESNSTANDTAVSEPLFVNALLNATANDWRVGIVSGTLTQLPLTTLNSCLSVCMLAHTLFPSRKVRRVSRRSVCISIGLVNFFGCPLGMMPTCHGAGGLASQHRLGANGGMSMVVLGLFKIAIGLIACQGSLLHVLDAIPVSILAILLVLAGHELAATGVIKIAKSSFSDDNDNRIDGSNEQGRENGMVICLMTALLIVATGHTHIGTLCGLVISAVYSIGSAPGSERDQPSLESSSRDARQTNRRGRYTFLGSGQASES